MASDPVASSGQAASTSRVKSKKQKTKTCESSTGSLASRRRQTASEKLGILDPSTSKSSSKVKAKGTKSNGVMELEGLGEAVSDERGLVLEQLLAADAGFDPDEQTEVQKDNVFVDCETRESIEGLRIIASTPDLVSSALEFLDPAFVVVYSGDLATIRSIELHQAIRKSPLSIYYFVYDNSVEEQRFYI